MSEPDLVIRQDHLDRSGLLSAEHLAEVSRRLLRGQYALVPSDTSYSLAAIPVSATVRDDINAILRREPAMPISLAFDSVQVVRQWVDENPIVDRLLRRYCPGPITIVCAANPDSRFIPARFFKLLMAGNRTIGVRIPDSPIERQLAAAVRSPITTTAVRTLDGRQAVVTDFEQAREIIRTGTELIGLDGWPAIEGSDFGRAHSTVVLVTRYSEQIRQVRAGELAFADVVAAARGAAP